MTVVLVTGGAGFVGSHACKALLAAGFSPVTLDNLCRGHSDAIKWGPLEIADLNDRPALDRVFAQHRPVAVLHFAALAYVGEFVTQPLVYHRNNAAGTLTLLEAMVTAGCNKIVLSSSCATYGVAQTLPITENHPQVPINPYGQTKLICEQMLAAAGAAHGLRSIALRYFNAGGSDPEAEIGERHDPETHLIPLVLQAAAGLRERVRIFGTDYATPDGTCVRDYVHVSDLADAHVLALRALLAGGVSAAYNLSYGQGASVRDVIAAAEHVTGRRIPTVVEPRRAGDPPILVGSGSRARAELGWTPRYQNLDVQIRDAWRWMNRHRDV